MLQRFKEFIAHQQLFSSTDRLLLAVSGGRDSVCMLHLAREAGFDFAIAHCNFHLRPADCDRDQSFVSQLASDLGVPFFTTDFDTRAFAAQHTFSLEQAARLLRYSYFATLCQSEGFAAVATAHHRDDAVETFFLNLFRGTGIAGLHGIRPTSHQLVKPYLTPHSSSEHPIPLNVVHPMLCFSRADIDHYLQLHHLSYVDDATNFEPEVQRNRIRLQLMPLLRELYPSVDATMQANIERLHEAELIVGAHVAELHQRLCTKQAPQLPWLRLSIDAFSLADLSLLSPRRALLFELLRPYGFNADAASHLDALLPQVPTGPTFFSPTHEAVADRGKLLIAPRVEIKPPVVESLETMLPTAFNRNGEVVYVAPDKLHLPLTLRPWQHGDRFQPFGMTGERLVSDFLKDIKLNALEKRHVHLLVDADGRVVWVVGLRGDQRFRVDDRSKPCLQISVLH